MNWDVGWLVGELGYQVERIFMEAVNEVARERLTDALYAASPKDLGDAVDDPNSFFKRFQQFLIE